MLEERIRSVLESIAHAVLILDCDGRIIFANKSAESILGYSRKSIIGRTFLGLGLIATKPTNRQITEQERSFLTVVNTKRPVYGIELAAKRPDGTSAMISANAGPLYDVEGNIIGVLVSFFNTTRRKAVEKLLAESERRFRNLLESAQLVATILDIDGNITFINDHMLKVTGWQWGQVIMRNFFDVFIPPVNRDYVENAFISSIILKEVPAHLETEILTRSGGLRTISFNQVLLHDPDGNIMGLASIGEDVTERREAEKSLRRGKELSDALNNINASINSTLNFEEIMQRVVNEAAGAVGCDYAAVYLRDGDLWLAKYVYGYGKETLGARFSDSEVPFIVLATKSGKPLAIDESDLELHCEKAKGINVKSALVVPLQVKGESIGALCFKYPSRIDAFDHLKIDFAGKLAPSVSLALDNARLYEESRRAQEELRKSEAKYRMLVEQMPAVTYIISLDVARVKHYVSPQLNKLLGYDQEEFMREPGLWRKYIHPEDYENVSAAIENACANGESLAIEYRLLTSDGNIKWFRDQAIIAHDESGEPLFLQGIILDITENKSVDKSII